MAPLSEQQLDYLLSERRLAHLATIEPSGRLHVVPVGWSYNADLGAIEVSGHDFANTRKYRNVQSNPNLTLVVDDVLAPWRPRCVMIQASGHAIGPEGDAGAEALIRITPEHVISFGDLDARS